MKTKSAVKPPRPSRSRPTRRRTTREARSRPGILGDPDKAERRIEALKQDVAEWEEASRHRRGRRPVASPFALDLHPGGHRTKVTRHYATQGHLWLLDLIRAGYIDREKLGSLIQEGAGLGELPPGKVTLLAELGRLGHAKGTAAVALAVTVICNDSLSPRDAIALARKLRLGRTPTPDYARLAHRIRSVIADFDARVSGGCAPGIALTLARLTAHRAEPHELPAVFQEFVTGFRRRHSATTGARDRLILSLQRILDELENASRSDEMPNPS